MSKIKSKITWPGQKQENLNLNGKIQSIDANTEMIYILELCDNDFKAAL